MSKQFAPEVTPAVRSADIEYITDVEDKKGDIDIETIPIARVKREEPLVTRRV